MALPPLTHEGIKPYIHEDVYAILLQKFQPDEIPQLFGDGVLRKRDSEGVTLIQMKWHKDADNRVNGIFFRFLNEKFLLAWIPPDICRKTHNYMWIQNEKTQAEKHDLGGKPHLYVTTLLNSSQKPDTLAPQFNAEVLDRIDAIAEFFKDDREMLPDSIRAQVFPPPPQDPAPEQKINWTYAIGGVLGIFLIGYIALKVFNRTHPQPIQS